MLLVFVHCKQDSAADELKSLNEELKEFFENGEGKDCRLVALFTKAVCTYVEDATALSVFVQILKYFILVITQRADFLVRNSS